MLIIVIVLLVMLVKSCSSDNNCADLRETWGESSPEYQQCLRSGGSRSRTGGGSYGGFGSGGGGHK